MEDNIKIEQETFYFCKRCDTDLIVAKKIGYLKICVCKSCGKIMGYYDLLREFLDKKAKT